MDADAKRLAMMLGRGRSVHRTKAIPASIYHNAVESGRAAPSPKIQIPSGPRVQYTIQGYPPSLARIGRAKTVVSTAARTGHYTKRGRTKYNVGLPKDYFHTSPVQRASKSARRQRRRLDHSKRKNKFFSKHTPFQHPPTPVSRTQSPNTPSSTFGGLCKDMLDHDVDEDPEWDLGIIDIDDDEEFFAGSGNDDDGGGGGDPSSSSGGEETVRSRVRPSTAKPKRRPVTAGSRSLLSLRPTRNRPATASGGSKRYSQGEEHDAVPL
eukprot:g1622.t1